MQAMGLVPEVVVVRHAYIYTRGKRGYYPHLLWNLRILIMLWVDRLCARRAIAEWHSLITRATHGVRTVRRKRDRLWLRFNSEEAAEYAAHELEQRVKEFRHFRVFRYRREVDVRSVPFTKGMAVKELARHMGVAREHILAIGNGHNDISALDGGVAKFVGCPANSEPEVMEVVHEAKGHIASGRSLSGVVEILDAYANGVVSNDLPVWWENPSEGDNPWPNHSRRSEARRRKRVRSMALAAVAGYTVLIVFASFGIVPGADAITRPYRAVVSVCERGLERFWSVAIRVTGAHRAPRDDAGVKGDAP
jgi:hypothetical protein